MIEKIISGGQTGVDRAALDVALARNIPCGGWCPAGRAADDGPIADKYPLQETSNIDHTVRTGFNVRDSDGTLILCHGDVKGGTAYAVETAKHMQKPVLVINSEQTVDMQQIKTWLEQHQIKVLHIGGPREASRPGIYQEAYQLIDQLIDQFKQPDN